MTEIALYPALEENSLCPKCQIGEGLQLSDGLEFGVTIGVDWLHCYTCGASFFKWDSEDKEHQYIYLSD